MHTSVGHRNTEGKIMAASTTAVVTLTISLLNPLSIKLTR